MAPTLYSRAQTASASPHPANWHAEAAEKMDAVIEALALAHALADILAIVRVAARDLTGADGATFVLREGDQCYYAEENAISPLWKGQRFPMAICVSGWVMQHREAVFIADIYKDPRVLHAAYRPTFVRSLMMVPIRHRNPLGAIGNYWAQRREISLDELWLLQILADATAQALEKIELPMQN